MKSLSASVKTCKGAEFIVAVASSSLSSIVNAANNQGTNNNNRDGGVKSAIAHFAKVSPLNGLRNVKVTRSKCREGGFEIVFKSNGRVLVRIPQENLLRAHQFQLALSSLRLDTFNKSPLKVIEESVSPVLEFINAVSKYKFEKIVVAQLVKILTAFNTSDPSFKVLEDGRVVINLPDPAAPANLVSVTFAPSACTELINTFVELSETDLAVLLKDSTLAAPMAFVRNAVGKITLPKDHFSTIDTVGEATTLMRFAPEKISDAVAAKLRDERATAEQVSLANLLNGLNQSFVNLARVKAAMRIPGKLLPQTQQAFSWKTSGLDTFFNSQTKSMEEECKEAALAVLPILRRGEIAKRVKLQQNAAKGLAVATTGAATLSEVLGAYSEDNTTYVPTNNPEPQAPAATAAHHTILKDMVKRVMEDIRINNRNEFIKNIVDESL